MKLVEVLHYYETGVISKSDAFLAIARNMVDPKWKVDFQYMDKVLQQEFMDWVKPFATDPSYDIVTPNSQQVLSDKERLAIVREYHLISSKNSDNS